MKLVQVTEQNKKYYTKEFIHGFNVGAKTQYEADSKERLGRWIHRPVEEWGASNCKCSICGAEYFFPLLLKGGADNYCGNCGARMVEEANPCDTCENAKYTNLEDDDSPCRDCGVGE